MQDQANPTQTGSSFSSYKERKTFLLLDLTLLVENRIALENLFYSLKVNANITRYTNSLLFFANFLCVLKMEICLEFLDFLFYGLKISKNFHPKWKDNKFERRKSNKLIKNSNEIVSDKSHHNLIIKIKWKALKTLKSGNVSLQKPNRCCQQTITTRVSWLNKKYLFPEGIYQLFMLSSWFQIQVYCIEFWYNFCS